jgi:hypothetical protein
MANLPPEIEPAKLLEMLKAEDPSICTETSTRAGVPLSTASVLADELSSEAQSFVDRYGPIIIGLLAVNAVIGVIVLAFSIFNLMQRRALAGRLMRPDHHYVPVKSHATSH